MNTLVKYQKLTSDNAKQYRKLRLQSLQLHPESFLSIYEEQVKLEEMFFEKCLRENNSKNLMYGAFENDELIGICGFVQENKKPLEHSGEIIQMFVIPEKSGNKIGQNLLSYAVAKIFENSTIEQISLWVNSDIISANKIYERVGFKECGFIKNAIKINDSYKDLRLMMLYK